MGFLTRETMETAQNYQQAQDMLAKTLMIAPAYFILGGTSPGQVSYFNHCFSGTNFKMVYHTN